MDHQDFVSLKNINCSYKDAILPGMDAAADTHWTMFLLVLVVCKPGSCMRV